MRYLLATAVLFLGVTSSTVAGRADTPSGKHRIPTQQAQADAIDLARQVFAKSLDEAKTFDQKRDVTRRILNAAGEVQDSTERYVLLRAARNIAAGAGDVDSAMWAIDELDRWFHINRRAMLVAALSEAADATRLSDPQKLQIATKLLDAAEEAIDAGDVRCAASLRSKAIGVTRTSRDAAARTQIALRAKVQQSLLAKYRHLPDALKTLETNPADPSANLLVGRFHALVRGDWARAIALFERCSAPAYRAIAAQELLQPLDANSHVRIGDGWWSLAQQEDELDRPQLLRRASHWYRMALPQLPPGLTRMKVADRLKGPAAPNPVLEAARKVVEELVEMGNRVADEQRVAADRARREAKKAQDRELRRQIAVFRRRELERTVAFKRERALREFEARARFDRRTFYYPVRNYYVDPRTNYFSACRY
jgi:hypothetical protein